MVLNRVSSGREQKNVNMQNKPHVAQERPSSVPSKPKTK